jgi:hypothetical protein
MNIAKRATLLAALALATASCGADEVTCVPPPCLFPIAMRIHVRSATGIPITTAFVQELNAAGAVISTADCGGTGDCMIGQHPGMYRLRIGAPQFFVNRDTTVNVTGTQGGRCSCTMLDTKEFTFTLIVDPSQFPFAAEPPPAARTHAT